MQVIMVDTLKVGTCVIWCEMSTEFVGIAVKWVVETSKLLTFKIMLMVQK